ncbi:MAG: RNA 2',3'-cyclic phosphodiesterase [Acidimicrobiia bacterium]
MALRRLFIAVALTDDALHALASLLDGVAIPGRAVAPSNWHITLRFIGDTDDVTGDRLTAALDGADLGESFLIRWGGLGAFPRPTRATVLWVGLEEGAEPLLRLAEAVEAAVTAAGVPSEDRPVHPHLTLARIRPGEDVSSLVGSVAALDVRMQVERVSLFQSHLGRGGARYEVVESFALR